MSSHGNTTPVGRPNDHFPKGHATTDDAERRSFLFRLTAASMGILALAVPLASAITFLCWPLRTRRRSDSAEFLPVPISLDALPADGTPIRVTMRADRVDAWNRYPNERIGAIWLRRTPDGAVQALSSICPHLGCSVEFRSGAHDFFCPCHTSAFDLDGKRLNKIPPRNMDTLEVRTEQGRIWVRYRRFRGGIPEKVPV